LKQIKNILYSSRAELGELPSLMKRLNNLCMMCPFLKIWLKEVAVGIEDPHLTRGLSEQAKKDLLVYTVSLLNNQ
jgi:hypothetical protein